MFRDDVCKHLLSLEKSKKMLLTLGVAEEEEVEKEKSVRRASRSSETRLSDENLPDKEPDKFPPDKLAVEVWFGDIRCIPETPEAEPPNLNTKRHSKEGSRELSNEWLKLDTFAGPNTSLSVASSSRRRVYLQSDSVCA
ncbi:hypothetical protein CEXT_234221 [Caerostris extrusa]|uniref:Uncharacterized protein n=1 Tax=Caerostris extrusa TaxID=172846 RepID=A0AAV4QY12_CAEEX|nr:hypothetical protein CEXT_234221 [Caerostris extrusa]